MIKGDAIIWMLFTSIFFACTDQVKTNQSPIQSVADTMVLSVDSTKDMGSFSEDAIPYGQSEYIPSAQTRLRFKNFNLIIHDFAGYESVNEEDANIYDEFNNGIYTLGGYLNNNEKEQDGYAETLIVTSDTVHLSESLSEGFDNKIRNTLFEIVPNQSTDTYKISYCYQTAIYEMFEHLKIPDKEREKFYENGFYRKEHSSFISVRDSANRFFRLITLKDGEQQALYTNGSMSQEYWQKEMKRIRNQYGFKDTLIQYSGEGGSWYATLTKKGRIYGYDTGSYLIRIERYTDNGLAETKYIVIVIASGC